MSSKVTITNVIPNASSKGSIITIYGSNFLNDTGNFNVLSVGFLSLPDNEISVYSNNFTVVSPSEIIFDTNNFVGTNGFTFENNKGTLFGVVLQDINGILTYVNSDSLYLIDT